MSKNTLKAKSNYTLEKLIKHACRKTNGVTNWEDARKIMRSADSILRTKGGRNCDTKLSYEEILHIRGQSEIYFDYRTIEQEFAREQGQPLG